MFPLDIILNDSEFEGMNIVVCGHSLGGAIASIVAIELFISLKKLRQERSVHCITFGAPLVGDRVLQNNIPKELLCCMHHFVSINDPIPHLLRYTQSISPWLQDVNKHLPLITPQIQDSESIPSEESLRNKLAAIRKSYSEIINIIDKVMSIIDAAVDMASIFYPAVSAVKKFQTVFSLVHDFTTAIKDNKDVYTAIGNFHFLTEDIDDNDLFSWDQSKELEKYVLKNYQQNTNRVDPNAHALSHYTNLFHKNRSLPFNIYNATNAGQNVQFKIPFTPLINSVHLTKINGKISSLKLSFTGKYIHNVVLDLCKFKFDFPFLNEEENVEIRKYKEEDSEILEIEKKVENISISREEHGTKLNFVTQFGNCEQFLWSQNVHDIAVEGAHQIAENDSVPLIVKRAIQRAMVLESLKAKESYSSSSEQIIEEIFQLGTLAIGEDLMKKKKTKIFEKYVDQIDDVFSNKESYQSVKDLGDEIESYIQSPLVIEAESTTIKKIAIGFSAIAGAIAGCIASPCLVSIGLVEAMSTGLVCLGGATGSLAAVAAAKRLVNDQLVDSNYRIALRFIGQKLLEAQQESLGTTVKAEISNLLYKQDFLSNEKALIRLAPKTMLGTELFENCIISKSTTWSKEEIIKRIKVIQSIHKIREIFSQQCFIGVVGLQDAGKTTLVRKIWNVSGESGYFTHTKHAKLYQITQKLIVVDFPGSNGLHYYSNTFKICGAINNMLIVVMPFSGDASEIYTQEIANVFKVMKGSKSTKVIFCFNKVGKYLKNLREDPYLSDKPRGFFKEDFIGKLNNYFETNDPSIELQSTNTFFTDWELEDNQEPLDFEIVGVKEIIDIIKDYLVCKNVYNDAEKHELDQCFPFISN